MPKKKNNTSCYNTNPRKSCGYLILDKKSGKNLKRQTKTLLSHLARTDKASNVKTNGSYHLIVILECTTPDLDSHLANIINNDITKNVFP